MYHPARIREVIGSGDEMKLLVETWDENTLTLDTEDLAEDALSEDRVVLLDYSPDPRFDLPSPRQVVTTVLSEEQGERIWETYRETFNDQPSQQTGVPPAQQVPFDGNYIG